MRKYRENAAIERKRSRNREKLSEKRPRHRD